MQDIRRNMAIGSCKPARRSSTTGSRGAALFRLVVFNCRSSIAILSRRQHVLRRVHASIGCRVILECSPRLFEGRRCGRIVDGNVLLLHLCKGKVGADRVEEGKEAEWALMV